MKKSNLIIGLIFVMIGIGCLTVMIFSDTVFEMTLLRCSAYCLIFGALTVGRYIYRNLPVNREIYSSLEEYENRELNDELNIHLRNKASRYAYIFGLYTICLAVVVFDILGTLGLVENAGVIIISLGILLAVQILSEKLFLRYLKSRYN